MQRTVDFFRSQVRLFILLIIVCLSVLLLYSYFGIIVNVFVIGLLIAISSIFLMYHRPVLGLLIITASVFLLPLLIKAFRLYTIPVTTFIELLNFLLMIILIIKGKFTGWKTLPGILVGVWLVFQIMEIFNPNASSRIAGFVAIRVTITFALAFYNAYSSINSLTDVKILLKGLIFFGLLAALYGFYQEYVGLPGYDYAWAIGDEFRYKLLYTFGRLRKFSFFTSPSEFGLVMAYTALASFIPVFFQNQRIEKKLIYGSMAIIMMIAMMFTGARTAMVLVVAGVLIFALITFWRSVLIMLALVGVLAIFFVIKPTSNKSLKVMFTAFEGTDDPSMNVRLINQKRIREYIKTKPLGFGVGSTGYYGAKYSSNTFIGSFPPDSELVKIAIETGWLGLILWCGLLASIFIYGVNGYFNSHNYELKSIMLIPLVVFFMMIIGQYPQECFRAPVLSTLFSFAAALISKLRDLDSK